MLNFHLNSSLTLSAFASKENQIFVQSFNHGNTKISLKKTLYINSKKLSTVSNTGNLFSKITNKRKTARFFAKHYWTVTRNEGCFTVYLIQNKIEYQRLSCFFDFLRSFCVLFVISPPHSMYYSCLVYV